ncbi:hypothetical protein DPMN_119395 [Dreissena polymorpha]|uniref:Uncharacterized protein n=1 Tax=Dreissena polymorpha TaxID=45954 RepID=A0A9D4GIR2_DREPO|nr:hypothetical protein DPMN_119395 [Dreissena polymorpha]
MNDKDEAMISAYVVESANGIKPNVPRTQLQQCLETALNKLKEGFDVKIHEIKHKCVAIHLGFPTLKRWLEFLHGYFNGDIGNIFVPLQEHLRYLCFEDLEFTVVVYEKDFIKCSQAISVELDTLSCGKILHFEHEETEKSPVRVEETTFGTASENFDLRNEYAPGELETPDTAPENDPDQTVRAAEQETPSRLRAKGTNNYHSSSSSSIDKVGEQDTSSRVWTIETSSEYADNKC